MRPGGLVNLDDGWRMPDWLWELIVPLLPDPPPHPLGCHRPRVPDRSAMDAILLVLRTGMRWNALATTGICSSSSAHRRYQEWARAGVFAEIERQGLLARALPVGSGLAAVRFTRDDGGRRAEAALAQAGERAVVQVGERAVAQAGERPAQSPQPIVVAGASTVSVPPLGSPLKNS